MVKTPPYQKRGKCGHFMPQFDSQLACFGCRAKCKEQDPCAQGAKINQCAACSMLSDEQWTHLRESFAKRSSYRNRTSSHNDNIEPETDDKLLFTSEELSQVDNILLDLELEQSSNVAPVTGISPLNNQPSSASLPAMSFPVNTRPVPQPSASSSALFRMPDRVPAQDTIPAGQTPNRQYMADKMATFSLPQPQRTASSLEIPQTPRTQQPMENMFNRLDPAQTNPAPQATNTQLHIVSITPLSVAPAATKFEEPMDSTPSQKH